jgi:hypothetical protein
MKSIIISFIVLALTSCSVFFHSKVNHTLEVEFYSKGSGIDYKSKKLLEEFVVSYNEANRLEITFTSTKQGKEGETTYFFNLNSLSKKEREHFKTSLNEQLKNASNYRIKEVDSKGY